MHQVKHSACLFNRPAACSDAHTAALRCSPYLTCIEVTHGNALLHQSNGQKLRCQQCMCAESVRRQAIREVLTLDVSPSAAQRIWLRVSGVLSATFPAHISFQMP